MDTLTVTFPKDENLLTKGGVLKSLVKVYDPLGSATPYTLQGKLIYREICNQRIPWNAEFNPRLFSRVHNWGQTLPTGTTVPALS